jgi:hypothetical protein
MQKDMRTNVLLLLSMLPKAEDGGWKVACSIDIGRNTANQRFATSDGFIRDTGNPPTGKRINEVGNWMKTIRITRQVDQACHRCQSMEPRGSGTGWDLHGAG